MNRAFRRHVVHFRRWPGTERWRPPTVPEPHPPRLGDRIGVVLVAASELGADVERFGLGAYLVVTGRSIISAGVIVADDLNEDARAAITRWAAEQMLSTPSGPQPWGVETVAEFLDPRCGTFAKRAYSGAGWCIGADLGRVFGLVAEHWGGRLGANARSWEVWLPGWGKEHAWGRWKRVSPHRPPLWVESRRVGWRVRFAPCEKDFGKYHQGRQWPGAFLDVLSLAYALDADRGASFSEHRENFDLAPVELPVAVPVDANAAAEMAGAVLAVRELALVLDDRASRWFTSHADRRESRCRIDLARLSSPGGIAAQIPVRFGHRAPHLTFGLSEEESQGWAESLHGGWCEADPRLLGVPLHCASVDVASCHPMVAELIGWWELLCAERIVRRKVTAALRRLCERAVTDPGVVLDPEVWRRFGCCLVRVRPDFEAFPIELEDPLRPDGRLEVLPVSSPDRPVWMTALNVIAASVKSKKVPEIIEATAYVADGRQSGLRSRLSILPGVVASIEAGPARRLVEHRQKAKADGDLVLAGELRLVVNALVFGNFARMDEVLFREGRTWVRGEKPGPLVCLPIASSVTAGSHLLLAVLERLVMDRGGIIAYRDTDSSIIPASPDGGELVLPDGTSLHQLSWAEVDEMLSEFDGLISKGQVWKCARGDESSPMETVVFGPKRHVEKVGEEIVDLTEQGLGGSYMDPPTMRGRSPQGYRYWSSAAVKRELDLVLSRSTDHEALRQIAPWDIGQDLPFPALRRLMVKTPEMARMLPSSLGVRPGTRYIEARGATWSGASHGRTVATLDPGGDLSNWLDLHWVDRSTGVPMEVTTGSGPEGALILETLDERASLWSRPPRSEPIDEVIIDPDLVAYPGRVSGVIDADEDGIKNLYDYRPMYKEADRLKAVQKEAERLGKRSFSRMGIPPTVAERAARGMPISARNVARALAAMANVGPERTCALDGCDQTVTRPNAFYCTPAHTDQAYRLRKSARPPAPASSMESECPRCGAVLYGEAMSRACPICSDGSSPQ